MIKPLCFVLMPFGEKPDADGRKINFDAVYEKLIKPAIDAAGLESIRADEEVVGGIIHKPMFERLILCEYAVADLTTANPNVYYELGVRHAVIPETTIMLYGGQSRLPFDVAPLRTLPYKIDSYGWPQDEKEAVTLLTRLLSEAKSKRAKDSPVFQLLEGFPDIKRLKTDVFRERVEYSMRMKEKLAEARKQGLDAIRAVDAELPDSANAESAVVIDLFLSYRAVKGWKEMIALAGRMSRPLAQTVLVREQYALALNRDGQAEKAEKVLLELIAERGPNSETNGILGRVYKDRWESAVKAGHVALAKGYLRKAIDAYLAGFESDWRDAYPGVNALTLMTLGDAEDPRVRELIPVVTYAVKRRIASGKPDYWDHATLLELAVIAKDESAATEALGLALTAVREIWEPETTARNLRLIGEARKRRNEETQWIKEVEIELLKTAQDRSI